MYAMSLFKPGGKARYGLSAFDPKFMRAMQRGQEFGAAEWRWDIGALQQAAGVTHRACQKLAQNADSLGPPDRHQQAAMMDGNPREWRDFRPGIPGTARTLPGFMRRLASDGDKAEIANAGTIGLRVTVKNSYFQAAPRSM